MTILRPKLVSSRKAKYRKIVRQGEKTRIARKARRHHCDHVVPLRKKRPNRRIRILRDPVRDDAYLRGVKHRRKQLIRKTHLRIMKLLPGGPEYSPWSDKIRAILEDVL
ncbi:MAG: hypothetical protein PHU54_07180 [Candidatus Omnitrophica bacterium]|jgi:hypothetical protein|nr:hypothetical protein [Candidatus Omnitrophota bacterium]